MGAKNKHIKGFTEKYNVDKLIYFEVFDFIDLAIAREKQIKGYSRAKKMELINSFNFEWKDLYNNGKIAKPDKRETTPINSACCHAERSEASQKSSTLNSHYLVSPQKAQCCIFG